MSEVEKSDTKTEQQFKNDTAAAVIDRFVNGTPEESQNIVDVLGDARAKHGRGFGGKR